MFAAWQVMPVSITDELREYAQSWRETPSLMDDLDAGDVDGILADFEHIADRIDAEHEKVMSRAGQLLDDAEKERDYNYAYWQDCKQKVLQHNITMGELSAEIERLEDELSHCIELPKDADGEPIHIGDVMESKGSDFLFGEVSFEVRAMRCDECGWEVYDRLGDRYAPLLLRHHHAPTVEDVLREFVDALDIDRCEDFNATIAEYAAKLRLAGDAE